MIGCVRLRFRLHWNYTVTPISFVITRTFHVFHRSLISFFLSSILILASSFLLLSFLLLSFSPPQAVKCITCSNSLCLFTDDVESDSEEASGQNGESDFVSSLLFKLSVVVSFTFMCVCVCVSPPSVTRWWSSPGALCGTSQMRHQTTVRCSSTVVGWVSSWNAWRSEHECRRYHL